MTRRFRAAHSATMRRPSSGSIGAPVGLLGLQSTTARVRGVTCGSRSDQRTANVFRSPGLDTDETYAYTFTRPGTYEYYCTLHPLMTGKVIVRSRS